MGKKLENILGATKKAVTIAAGVVSGSFFGWLGYESGYSIGKGVQTTRQYNSCSVTPDGHGVNCVHHVVQTLPNLPYGEIIGAIGLALGVTLGAGMVYDVYKLRHNETE